MMIEITNNFHNTTYRLHKAVGDTVPRSTLNRVRRALCGFESCTCGREDGSRESRYGLEDMWYLPDTKIEVVDRSDDL